MDFTTEQIRMLGEMERKMDAGEVPFVMLHGGRVSMTPESMDYLGLKQGQTINDAIFRAHLRFMIAFCEEKIVEKKLREQQDGPQ